MLYPEHQFEQKLNFSTIREWLKEECMTIIGRENAEGLTGKSQEKVLIFPVISIFVVVSYQSVENRKI
jgi:hypothetical protein